MAKTKKREGFFSKNILGDIHNVPDALVDLAHEDQTAKKRIEELERQLRTLKEEKAAQMIANETRQSEVKKENDALKQQTEKMQKLVKTLKNEKQLSKKREQSVKQPEKERDQSLELLMQENQRIRERLIKAEKESPRLQKLLIESNQEIDKVRKKVKQLESERQKMVENITALKEENKNLIGLNENIKKESIAEKNALQKLKNQLDEFRKENNKLKEKNEQLGKERSKEAIESIQSEYNKLKQENDQSKDRIKELEESSSVQSEIHEQERLLKRDREAFEAEIRQSQQEIGEVLLNAQKQGNQMIERAKMDAKEIMCTANEELAMIKLQVKDISLAVEESKQSVMDIYSELQARIRKMSEGVNEGNQNG